ncbi:MAG: MTH938/NDUFAF3 family protein [Nitrospiraceae bacterium]|nr:MTH938/NDUFAF3 family protein [Nitrospiraceae bacterium]
MKIDSFSFGKIIIEGKTYTTDVIVYPDGVHDSWPREEEHRPQVREFAEIVKAAPDILIIGTGYGGVMSIPDQLKNYLLSQGIDVRVEKTGKAVELFNSLQATDKVIAALHITC